MKQASGLIEMKTLTALLILISSAYIVSPISTGMAFAQTIWRKGTPVSDSDKEDKALFDARNDPSKLEKLISMLEARNAGEGGIEDMLLLAYCYYWRGILLEDADYEKEAKAAFRKGSKIAERLKDKHPQDPAGYLWYTIIYGRYQKLEGVTLDSLTLYDKFKKCIDKAEALQKGYFFGGADRFWGYSIFEVPTVVRFAAGFSLDDAVNKLENSYNINPNYFESGYTLAVIMIERDDDGDVAKAKRILQKIIDTSSGVLPEFKPENEFYKKQARKLLNSL